MAKFYLVGGAVRDKLLGVKVKDLDYAVEAGSYDLMKQAILERGGNIFLESPQFFTIRAKMPKLGVADYVLCRKEGVYKDGRHPESVEPGTLLDDLARRDFTVNAMAENEWGNIIDPYNGIADLKLKNLRTVGKAAERFEEDSLRLLRAIRFAVTKGFKLHYEIKQCLSDKYFIDKLKSVSNERIREELHKCFSFDTVQTLGMFWAFPHLLTLLEGNLWLKPTLEKKD